MLWDNFIFNSVSFTVIHKGILLDYVDTTFHITSLPVMDRFCPLKNILTQWRQNKGHVIKYQTVHLNILVMSHSLISLFLILAFFFFIRDCQWNADSTQLLIYWFLDWYNNPWNGMPLLFCWYSADTWWNVLLETVIPLKEVIKI